jgi:hypothetical protein
MNDTQLTELRRTYAALLRTRASEQRPPDIPLERLLALVEGKGSDSERLATLDEVMQHPSTVRELEVLRAVAANRDASRGIAALVPRWRVTIPLLAAAALMIVAVPAVLRRNGSTGDITRAAIQNPVLVAPAEEPLAQESRTFRWRAVPGARAYTLEILTAAGTPVFTTRTSDTTVTIASDVRLGPGVEHRWWVASELADGTQRRSALRRLRVRAPK